MLVHFRARQYLLPVAASAVCFLGIALNTHLSHGRAQATSPAGFSTNIAGFSVSPLHLPPDHPTLVVAVQYGCSHCEAQMPFYHDLISREEHQSISSHIVFVAPNNDSELREMVGDGIAPDRLLAGIPLVKLGVTGTPTLLFIDRAGKIAKAWVGEVPSEYQRDVIAELR